MLKKIGFTAALSLALVVGGCQLKHQAEAPKKQDRVEVVAPVKAKPQLTLESLDARIGSLERSRVAYRKSAKAAGQPAF